MENKGCVLYLGCSAIEYAFCDEAGNVFLFEDFHDIEDVVEDAAESGGIIEGYEDCGVVDGRLNIDGLGASFAEFRRAFFTSGVRKM